MCATLGLTGATGTAAADAPGIPSVGHDWASAGPYTPNVSIGLVHTLYYPRQLGARGEIGRIEFEGGEVHPSDGFLGEGADVEEAVLNL